MAKKIALVGNGPSRKLYEEPFDGDVCLCNIPQIDVQYDYISIVDKKAMDYIHNEQLTFDKPILTLPETEKQTRNWNLQTEIQPVFKEKLMNSAATAAYYFAQSYDTIYLYGCDSLWSNDCSSSQDEYIPRAPRSKTLHLQWRTHWKKVWETGKQFVIVHPKDIIPEDYGKNVLWYTRSTK